MRRLRPPALRAACDPRPESPPGPRVPSLHPRLPGPQGPLSLLCVPVPEPPRGRGRGSRTPSAAPAGRPERCAPRRGPSRSVPGRAPPHLEQGSPTALSPPLTSPGRAQRVCCLSGCTAAGNDCSEVLLNIFHRWSPLGRAVWWSGCPLGLSGSVFKALQRLKVSSQGKAVDFVA